MSTAWPALPKRRRDPLLVIYRDARAQWRWRLKARNGRILAQGEGFTTASHARRSFEAVANAAPLARLVVRS